MINVSIYTLLQNVENQTKEIEIWKIQIEYLDIKILWLYELYKYTRYEIRDTIHYDFSNQIYR